jgi:hypothetical protein
VLLILHSKPLAATIGGAVGGVIDPEPIDSWLLPNTKFSTNPSLNRDALHDWSPISLLPEDTDFQKDNISPPPVPSKSGIPSATVHALTSSTAAVRTDQYSTLSRPSQPAEAEAIWRASATPSAMPTGMSCPKNIHLTEEQSEPARGLPTSPLPKDVDLETNNISPSPVPLKSGIPSVAPHDPTSSAAAAESQHSSQLPPATESDTFAHAFTTLGTVTAVRSPMTTRLTEEQSELVQSLIQHNIRLTTVAGVMQDLLGRDEPLDGEGSGSQVTQSEEHLEAENPPDYKSV